MAAFPPPPFVAAPPRVLLTGIGLVTPLGVSAGRSAAGVWHALASGACGVRELPAARLSPDPEEAASLLNSLTSKVAATVCPVAAELERCGGGGRLAPFAAYALRAAELALEDAGWAPVRGGAMEARTGVAVGCGMGDVAALAGAGAAVAKGTTRRLSPHLVPRVLANMAAGHVAMAHGLTGPLAAACASGAAAVAEGAAMVRGGAADAVLCGGTEACVDPVSLGGFARARALSSAFNGDPASASRPFDAARDGFVLGEGAAVVLLESEARARERGAAAYCEVRSSGAAADAHHVTAPPPDGRGARDAMRAALLAGGLEPSDVAYVNAHATSTPTGDDVEARALAAVFGDAFLSGALAVSSTKGATGHLLGAAGAFEAAAAALALSHATAPPTLNLHEPSLQGLPEGAAPNLVPLEAQRLASPRAVMSNSFGFGGVNVSLLLTQPPQ